MVHSVDPKGMTPHQISLVECALRQITRIEQVKWSEMPMDLHLSFARYMCPDAWTGMPDALTLRDAALLIVLDAITRSGEFGDGEGMCAGHAAA